MSLTTRCPACATVFRVVPDQLKVSQGWVRCGRCSELFDARATLSPQVPVVSEVVVEADADAPGEFAGPDAVPLSTDAPDAPGPGPKEDGPLAEPALADGEADERMAPVPDAREPTWVDRPVAASAAEAEVPHRSATDTPWVEESRTEQSHEEQRPPVLDQVSFVRRARRQAFWRQPLVRAGLAFMALALALALGGQVAYYQRDELAQRVPALAPLLSALCQPLQCRVGPPQRIESITIEASAFSRLQPDAFRLQFTLANAAPLPVALPALELTLTDSQDQAVIRRVLLPTELGPDAPAAIPAAGEWATAVTLTVAPAAAGTVTGYRLLAFYP